eukprot:1371829-Rhodomonas_salina.1
MPFLAAVLPCFWAEMLFREAFLPCQSEGTAIYGGSAAIFQTRMPFMEAVLTRGALRQVEVTLALLQPLLETYPLPPSLHPSIPPSLHPSLHPSLLPPPHYLSFSLSRPLPPTRVRIAPMSRYTCSQITLSRPQPRDAYPSVLTVPWQVPLGLAPRASVEARGSSHLERQRRRRGDPRP